MVITNIQQLENKYKKAIAFFALAQACISKRPYSLFQHKKIKNEKNEWSTRERIYLAFKMLFEKFKSSKIIVSYRDDGFPKIEDIATLLAGLGKKVKVEKMNSSTYTKQNKIKGGFNNCHIV